MAILLTSKTERVYQLKANGIPMVKVRIRTSIDVSKIFSALFFSKSLTPYFHFIVMVSLKSSIMLVHLLRKIKLRVLMLGTVFFSRLQSQDGLVHGCFRTDFSFRGRVVFGFWDGGLMHLGDQLFFLPLIMALKRSGVDVFILGPSPFDALYRGLGCRLLDSSRVSSGVLDGAVVILKEDMIWDARRLLGSGVYFVGFHFVRLLGDGRVSDLILNAVSRLFMDFGFIDEALACSQDELLLNFKKTSIINGAVELVKDWEQTLSDLPESSLLVFNDFAASAQLPAIFRRKLLWKKLKDYKRRGFKVVYVGTSAESKRRALEPELIDYDFRGQTSPMDLFQLLLSPQVSLVLGFDTFLVHAARVCGVGIDFVVKDKRLEGLVEGRFVPFFD